MSVESTQSEYPEKTCPLCGSDTEVRKRVNKTPLRSCEQCDHVVAISESTPRNARTDSYRIRLLEKEVEELRDRLMELEATNQ